jgi:hypothetical protein
MQADGLRTRGWDTITLALQSACFLSRPDVLVLVALQANLQNE